MAILFAINKETGLKERLNLRIGASEAAIHMILRKVEGIPNCDIMKMKASLRIMMDGENL